jgi:hypothetical protein
MKNVLSLAAEAEIGALFDNTKKAVVLRTILEEMQYSQPATPVQTDNSTACRIANSNLRQQHLRAIDMRFYWIRDRMRKGNFIFIGGRACLIWRIILQNITRPAIIAPCTLITWRLA